MRPGGRDRPDEAIASGRPLAPVSATMDRNGLTMLTVLVVVALALYLSAAVLLAVSFAGGEVRAPRAGVAVVGGAVLVHLGVLAAFTLRYGELPLVGLAPSLCTLTFLIGFILVPAMVVSETRPLGLVLVPLVALLLLVAAILGITPTGQPLAFRGVWFSFHVVLAFVGYAGLSVAFAAGILYLLQFRALKGRQLGRIFRFFPALDTLAAVGRWSLMLGFPALSLALLLGWAWTIRFQQSFATGNPQVIWGVVTWLTLLVMLMVGGRAGSDRRAALASVIGFAIVVVTYLVLRVTMVGGLVFL